MSLGLEAASPAGWPKVLWRGGPACWREKGLEVPQVLFQGRNRQVMSLSSPYQVGISVGRCPSPPATALPTGGCNCS